MSPSPAHWREHGGKKTPHSGWRHALLCGRAEPAPPRGSQTRRGSPGGRSPQITRKAIFSEGRGLRAREYRPYASPRYVIITGRQATARWPRGDMPRVKPVPFLAGVRSPPLRGGGEAGEKAYRGKARDDAEGGFFGGARSPRPYGQAVRKPGHNKIIGGKRTPGGQMGTCPWLSRSVPRGRAEPAPPRGGPSRARWPCGGKPGDDAKGDFLGGARSPRPRGKAGCEPGHNMIIGGKRIPGGQMGTCPWLSRSVPRGRAEPAPPRGGPSRARWPCGERPEMTRKAIFSEGRGLRARVVRLDASRGMSPSPAHWREHGGKKTPDSGWRHALLCGRAEPAPPRGGPSRARWPCGGKPGDDAKGDFLGGARSPRP